MIPIEKNIIVVDDTGKIYEATYPKRAKGLVKNGRARFIDEHTICLACPPNNELEDKTMSENKNTVTTAESKAAAVSEKLTMNYCLEQIEKIAAQTEHIQQAFAELRQITSNGPGDIGASSRAEVLSDIVKCKETTNQKLIALYEKMYDDLKQQPSEREKIIAMLLGQLENSNVPDTSKDYILEILQTALQDLSKNI